MTRKSRPLFRRQLARLRSWLTMGSLGIAPRLILAFGAVAALAAAANLIVEHGVALLEKQRSVAQQRSARDSRAIESLQESVARARTVVASAELSGALGRFERAVQEHAESDSASSASRLATTRAELDTMRDRHVDHAGADPRVLRELIDTHVRSGEVLLQSTRMRRSLNARYWSLLTRLDARVNESIDLSWKFAGHNVERQPLLDLRARLDGLRVAFANPVGGGVAAAESAWTRALRDHEAVLKRSEGLVWYAALEADHAALLATRVAFQQNDGRRVAALDGFARESRRLMTLLPARFEEPAPVYAPAPRAALALNNVEAPNRSLVAWVSAAVLLVLSYICFVTIYSIVRPVRRLIAATHKLAQGDDARVIASGGIRELESLAVAFNSMAQQLAVARAATADAQQKLEAKVEERTRQLQVFAEQDPLTGIANRRQLFIALNAGLEHARASGEKLGLFILDLDNFKTLNDSMGHPYGDRVLVAIARRLQSIIGDRGFAARLGGDEFTLVHHAAPGEEILAFGARIVQAFDAPLQVDAREVIVSVSVGAAIFPDHEGTAEALMRAADAALFNAKALGRSQLALFTPELLATASAKFAIEQRLRRAIQNDEFELFYQPLVDPHTGVLSMVEALIRWRTSDGGFHAPDEFLTVAEESGLIVEISDWVLRTAIRTAADWHRGPWPEARVAINVSARQLLDYRFVSRLEQLLDKFGLPPRCVELELTESVLQTGSHTVRTLDSLRALGVAIALDDFGTGYSSLASLQRLPLSRVKLDRSLIASIDESPRSAAIVRATMALCRGLGLEVTAEGVERLEQLGLLLAHRPITIQGFLFARPMVAGELPALLSAMPARCAELMGKLPHVLPPGPGAARSDKRRGLTIVKD